MAVTTTTEPTTARVTAPDVPHVVAEFIAEGVLANPPVAYLVAERREGRWIIGDEWSPEFATLAEARETAGRWRGFGHLARADVAVLALTVVSDAR